MNEKQTLDRLRKNIDDAIGETMGLSEATVLSFLVDLAESWKMRLDEIEAEGE